MMSDPDRSGQILDSPAPPASSDALPHQHALAEPSPSPQSGMDDEREAVSAVMALLAGQADLRELMRGATRILRRWSGCSAVGIRLRSGEDYPYFETRGFEEEFVLAENRLCEVDGQGELVRDAQGNAALECMCGNIIRGRFDPRMPCFTAGGSFWSNCTTRLLASTSEKDRQARTRNRCNGEGYESVALVPLRASGQTLGLLQFNDRRPDRFTPRRIEILERLGLILATAVAHRLAAADLAAAVARREAEATRRQRELAGLNALAVAVGQSLDRDTILETALEQTLAILDAEGVVVYLQAGDGQAYFPITHRNASDEMLRRLESFRPGEGLSGQVVATRTAIIVPDLHASPHNIVDRPSLGLWRSYAGVPIMAADHVLGVLVAVARARGAFDPDQIGLLMNAGALVGAAVANARLFRQAEEEAARRLAAEEGAREEARRLFELLERLPAIVAVRTADYRLTFTNRLFREVFEDPQGRPCYEVMRQRSAPCECCRPDRVLTSGIPVTREFTDGRGRTFLKHELRFRSWGDEDAILLLGIDITDRRRAEEEAHRFRTLADQAPYGMALTDREGRLVYLNEAMAAMHGLTVEESLGRHAGIFHASEQMVRVEDLFERLRNEGGFVAEEVDHVHRSGRVIPTLMSGTLIRDSQGQVTCMSATVVDLTGYKEAQNRQRRSEERFRSFFDLGVIGMAIESPDGKWLHMNDRLCEMYGYTREELSTRHWVDLTHPEDLDVSKDQAKRMAEGTIERFVLRKRYLRKDGSILHGLISGTCARTPDGRVDQVYVLVVDIGDLVLAEQALRESEATARTLMDNPLDAALLLDPEGRIVDLNPTMARRIGRPKHELVGRLLWDFYPPEITAAWQERIERILADPRPMRHEEHVLGGVHDSVVTPVLGPDDRVQKIALITRDITERKQAERRLFETQQRLRELGSQRARAEDRDRRELAEALHAGVSQMLYAIRTRLELLAPHLPADDARRQLAEIGALIGEAHQDVQRLTFDLCPPILYESGLEAALDWLAGEFRAQHGIPCQVVLPAKPLPLSADDATVLYRAARELLQNIAKHAQARAVRLEVSRCGDDLQVVVEDDGVGMDLKQQSCPDGIPRGFGLFSIRERVCSLGGEIVIEAAPGQGTRVLLRVPCPARAPEDSSAASNAGGRHGDPTQDRRGLENSEGTPGR